MVKAIELTTNNNQSKHSFLVMGFLLILFAALGSNQASARTGLPDFTDLVEEAAPAIVNISTVQNYRRGQRYGAVPEDMPEIFRHFFGIPDQRRGPDRSQQRTSLGSGFIISKDGYLLTNNHVIEGADEVFVRLNDRRELKAEVIGTDPQTDVALLKVDAKNLPTVKLGSSEKLKVGEWVVAIGSPFGFDASVTAGIVSAKGRSLPNENYVPFIQTDVAINPGNSGGPLFDLDGRVVGINSQIYTRSGGFMGLSFAIPIQVAMNVADQLKDSGYVSRGWLGVQIQEVNRNLAESFGMDKVKGALVTQVVVDGPAANAGIESGDIILEFNGRDINVSSDLPHVVSQTKPGSNAKLKIVRLGKTKTITVKIGTLTDDGVSQRVSTSKTESKKNALNIKVVELSDSQKSQAGNGVMVEEVMAGPGGMAGLIKGDIITHVNLQETPNVSAFNQVVDNLPTGRSLNIRVVRRSSVLFLTLRIPE